MRRSAQSQRAIELTPRLRRANDLLAESRSVALHRYERLTRAFEAMYLCCIDIAMAQQQELAATGHPLRKLVDGAALALELPRDDVIAITLLLRWCRFEVDVDDEPGTPEAACELALKVLKGTVAWHLAQTRKRGGAARETRDAAPGTRRRRARAPHRSDDPADR